MLDWYVQSPEFNPKHHTHVVNSNNNNDDDAGIVFFYPKLKDAPSR